MHNHMTQHNKKHMTSGQNSTTTIRPQARNVESARVVKKKLGGTIHHASKRVKNQI